MPVRALESAATLNVRTHRELPERTELRRVVAAVRADEVVAEGLGGFLWAALLRQAGFSGQLTVIPYVNPTSWYDVSCIAVYRRFAHPSDRVLVGSTPSARLLQSLGIDASVFEPYGVDCEVFRPRDDAGEVRRRFAIPPGRLLLFAGRGEPDKDLYRLLRVGLKARLLFPDLRIVLALKTVDEEYVAPIQRLGESAVHVLRSPTRADLARLYCCADVFVTAATSHFETFGRAPAEALACGTPAVAPRYDGFPETLAQPGGTVVELGETGVNEDALLRAVYETLSKPPERAPIAAAAARRFARERTLRRAFGTRPSSGAVEASFPLPRGWTLDLDLASLWKRGHARLSARDDEFRASVRSFLECR